MQRSWQRKTKSQPCRKHPVWRGMANSPPNPRIEEDVFPWRFPDKAEESELFGVFRLTLSPLISPTNLRFGATGSSPIIPQVTKGFFSRLFSPPTAFTCYV